MSDKILLEDLKDLLLTTDPETEGQVYYSGIAVLLIAQILFYLIYSPTLTVGLMVAFGVVVLGMLWERRQDILSWFGVY